MIDRNKHMPLYWQIKEILEKEILSGKHTVGEAFITEDALIERFGVSRVTAIKSLNILAREGYVKRQRMKGTILVSRIKQQNDKIILFLCQSKGHIIEAFALRTISGLSQSGFHPLVHDFSIDGFTEKFTHLLRLDPAYILVYGKSSFPFELLSDADKETVFLLNYEYDHKLPGAYVLSDYEKGARLQIEHLLDCGYRNILYLTYDFSDCITEKKRVNVFNEVIDSRNYNGRYLILEENSEGEEGVIAVERALKKLGKGTGVICQQDSRARIVYKAANRLRWNVPHDLGVIGYYNTPWSQALIPSLSSVSIEETMIADETVRVINEGKRQEVYIEPKLIIRSSTGINQ
ncbi:MAG: substrate-binding domain-containing protein [bacterium]|nr:substrate-binding domain-containing protein [bacterium]